VWATTPLSLTQFGNQIQRLYHDHVRTVRSTFDATLLLKANVVPAETTTMEDAGTIACNGNVRLSWGICGVSGLLSLFTFVFVAWCCFSYWINSSQARDPRQDMLSFAESQASLINIKKKATLELPTDSFGLFHQATCAEQEDTTVTGQLMSAVTLPACSATCHRVGTAISSVYQYQPP